MPKYVAEISNNGKQSKHPQQSLMHKKSDEKSFHFLSNDIPALRNRWIQETVMGTVTVVFT